MDNFAKRDLFGGALVVELPKHFGDGSERRQIPDHQEVYVDFTGNGHISATFDILEFVAGQGANANEDALAYHFNDILDPAEERLVWRSSRTALEKLPSTTALTAFSMLKSKKVDGRLMHQFRQSDPDCYGILMTLVRLPQKRTDIIITINVPYVPGEYKKEDVDIGAGRYGPLMDEAQAIQRRIFETFEIKDYSLFVDES